MAAPPLLLLLLLAVFFSSAAAAGPRVVGEDYVRPPPARAHRKALLSIFPWSKKEASASDPQQVRVAPLTPRGVVRCWLRGLGSGHSRIDELGSIQGGSVCWGCGIGPRKGPSFLD